MLLQNTELFKNLRTDASEAPPGRYYGAGCVGHAHNSNVIGVFTTLQTHRQSQTYLCKATATTYIMC